MNKVLMVLLIVAALAAGGYFLLSQNKASSTAEVYQENSTSVVLSEQNNSGEAGLATLIEQDGKLLVSLELTGAPSGVSQPAHIHTGTCADIGGVVWGLEFPLNGVSQTVLDTTLAELTAQMPLAINVHKSGQEASVYVACGDLVL